MKEIMSSILMVLLYISLFADYGLGVVHSFKKHGVADGIIGTALFPWAMYRGVEFWWHDDYANVNWDKRLTNDVQTCIYFISSSNDENADKYQINENLEKFSDKIKNYPEDKKRFLHDATKNYILFSNSITKDIFNSLSKYKTTGNYNLIESSETLKLERELSNFKLKEEINLYKKGFEELNKKMKSNLSNDTTLIDFDKIKEMETSMNYNVETQQKEFRRIFKTLFSEEL